MFIISIDDIYEREMFFFENRSALGRLSFQGGGCYRHVWTARSTLYLPVSSKQRILQRQQSTHANRTSIAILFIRRASFDKHGMLFRDDFNESKASNICLNQKRTVLV